MRALPLLFVAALLGACSGRGDEQTETVVLPSPVGFDAVARAMDGHCGALDCHGAPGRNLRLFGYSGQRLDPKDVPGGIPTTPEEAGADYCSVTSLEPELTAQVLAEGGAHPERLTLVRKARGTEEHKGDTVFAVDGEGDLCLLGWLSGKPQASHCNNSVSDLAHSPPVATSRTVTLTRCGHAAEAP